MNSRPKPRFAPVTTQVCILALLVGGGVVAGGWRKSVGFSRGDM